MGVGFTVEDLAGCATDDLLGWTDRENGETVRNPGALEGFGLSKDEAEHIIMAARVKAGWIDAAALEPAAEQAEEPAEGEPAEAEA